MENTQFASAVHIVVAVAHSECKKTSDELAAGIKAHPVAIRRVISRLVASGILISSRGKAGGIRLAKAPSEILLSALYKAVHTKKNMACREAEKKCPLSCTIQKEIDEISTNIEQLSLDYLSQLSIETFMKRLGTL